MTALNPEVKQPEQPASNAVEPIVTHNASEQNPTQQKNDATDQPATKEETAEDPNWRAFREARKRDRAEKEAAERKAAEKEREVAALKAAMEAAFANRGPTPQAYQQQYGLNQGYDEPVEDEEQRIERKVNELLKKKEEQYQREREEEEKRTYPNRLMKDMPDFSQICSQENLDYLDYHFPEISRPLQRLNDGYEKWYDTYHAIKKFIPNHSSAKKEAIKAAINTNKPRSMSSSTPSPTGTPVVQSWQEAEARRAENWQRMQRIMKGV